MAGDGLWSPKLLQDEDVVWPVMAAGPASQDVVLVCEDASAAACAALAETLTGTLAEIGGMTLRRQADPASDVPGALTIRLEMTRETETFVEGRLHWSVGGAAEQTGPLIEVSVMDATVTPAAYDDLARALVTQSALPL